MALDSPKRKGEIHNPTLELNRASVENTSTSMELMGNGAQHYCICSCTSTRLYFIWWSMNFLLHYHIYHKLLCMQCPLPDLTKSLWLTSSFYVVCLYFKLFQQEMKVIWGTTNFWPRSVHRGPAYPSLGVGFLWDIGGAHSPLIYLNYLNFSLFLNQLNYL